MRAVRFDIGSLKPAKRHPAGYLEVDGYLTRIGVFVYRNPDGSERREFRPPEEVFKGSSLASFARIPVTDGHPPTLLDAANAAQYARGLVGDVVGRDGDLVRASLTVFDAALIAKMEAGKSALSCGYTCDLEAKPGEYNGQKYDFVQRNITGNHLAIVEAGRAGDVARVRMDSASNHAVMVKTQEKAVMETITINGKTYAVEAEVAAAYRADSADKAQKLADAKAAADKAAARADAAEAQVKQLKARVEAAEDPKKIRDLVAKRVALEVEARKHLGDVRLDEYDDKAIKLKVLGKLAPKADLTGKSDEYINARFDSEVERAREANPALDKANAAAVDANGTVKSEARADEAAFDEEAARQRNLEWSRNAWKGSAKK